MVRIDTNSGASAEAPPPSSSAPPWPAAGPAEARARAGWLRTARYLAAWQLGRAAVDVRPVRVPVASRTVDADLYHPQGRGDPLRAWIVLHGLTRPGRRHQALVRFARALAASGALVLVPEIPAWRRLELAPEATDETVEGALRFLEAAAESGGAHPAALDPAHPTAPGAAPPANAGLSAGGSADSTPAFPRRAPRPAPDGVVLAGFSFGAPQALRVARDPAIAPRLAGVVAWGGYHDLARTIHFQLTGRLPDGADDPGPHDRADPDPPSPSYEGPGADSGSPPGEPADARPPSPPPERTDADHPPSPHLWPDAYGRWVVAGNCLPVGFPEARDVARALHRLAWASGDRQVPSDSPPILPLVATHRLSVAPERRALYDIFAPPDGGLPDPAVAREVVAALDGPVQRAFPLLDPGPSLGPISCPVRLLHSRTDRMIPYTETRALAHALAGTRDLEVTVTGLFSHSGHPSAGAAKNPLAALRHTLSEGRAFLAALTRVLALSEPDPLRPPSP